MKAISHLLAYLSRELRGERTGTSTSDAARAPRTGRQRTGAAGEATARRHLERAALVFVAANVGYRDGEVDLVMRDADGTLVFVEVRRRRRSTHGGAAASVTVAKQRRVMAAAARYLADARIDPSRPCRFDVVSIEGCGENPHVDWIRDAFRPEER